MAAPVEIEDPNWHRERNAPSKRVRMEAGRVGGGRTRQSRGLEQERALPLVAITAVVTGPKIKTVPQRVKRWRRWASRWSGVTVRGDRTRYASRWSAVDHCGLTTKKEFGLDRTGLLMEAATARKRNDRPGLTDGRPSPATAT